MDVCFEYIRAIVYMSIDVYTYVSQFISLEALPQYTTEMLSCKLSKKSWSCCYDGRLESWCCYTICFQVQYVVLQILTSYWLSRWCIA